jgi:hypothetical protein
MKNGFVLLGEDRSETVHPAHIMDAVHRDSLPMAVARDYGVGLPG